MATRNTQSSNVTELSFAEELENCIGELPVTPVWYKLDPNSYSDFGADLTLTPREPITKDRQKRKGVITDVDASGGFNLDFTYDNVWRLLQGFFYKDVNETETTVPLNSAQIVITNVDATGDTYDAASGLGSFIDGHLIFAEKFGDAGNNGLKHVTASSATDVTVSEALVNDASPASDAFFRTVGFEFDVATVDVDVSGDLPKLSRASGAVDWTTIGLSAGDFIFVGGDGATEDFVNTENNGFGRVKSITADAIEFDKFDATMVTETGTGLTIQIFFGDRLNNDTDGNNIDRRTYNLERTLGEDGVGTQSEYLVGATPNEITLNISESDKVTMDMSFVAQNHENRTGTVGVKTGTRADFTEEGAFNTSSDMSRIKIATVSATDEAPTSLVAYISELSLVISNGVFANKAIGVTGALEMGEAMFDVNGSMSAYFADVSASNAIKANNNVSLDFAIVQNNRGFAVDIPLIALGGGRVDVASQESLKMPLDMEGAKDDTLEYTVSMTRYAYLPTVAG